MAESQTFVYQPIGEPLTPKVLGAQCPCGQLVFSVAGLGLTLNLPEGMDLVAKCRCGRTHSLQEHSKTAAPIAETPPTPDNGAFVDNATVGELVEVAN